MRQFNERVVLQAIRLNGSCPKAEIARLTHLTAQTVQQIIGRLEADGLVIKRGRIRGRVGQPSVPMALNPDGAFAIGLTIGRRNLEVLLVDFCAVVRERRTLEYPFPDPDTLFGEIVRLVDELLQVLGPERVDLLCGVGVAAPLSLEGWTELLDVSPMLVRKWADIDIRARIHTLLGLPVEFVKDTAAACVAELVVGRGRAERNFLYFYVDTFIGGGIVLDSQLHAGGHSNAGAVGSLALAVGQRGQRTTPRQLLSVASLHGLQLAYAGAGLEVSAWRDERALQSPWRALTQAWLEQAAASIAFAIDNVACLLDIDSVIIDGTFGRELLDALLAHVREAFALYDWQGVAQPTLMPGSVGADARALGGALLPLYANFTPSRDLFLKLSP